MALPPPPLGSRRREGVSARSPATRGGGGNPPTCTAQTQAACSCGLSLHSEQAERQKAPLSRPWTGSEGDGRCEGRGGRPVETLQEAPPPGEISIPDAGKAFCALWKAGQTGAEERACKALPMLSVRSLYNWDRALARGGLNALVDQRGQAQAGRGILDKDTGMRDVVLSMLAVHPHAGSTHLAQGLAVRFSSCPHRLPSVRTIQRWTKQWREENKVLWAHLCDPDAAQGRYGAVKRHAKLHKNDTLNCTGGCYDKLRGHLWCAVGEARGWGLRRIITQIGIFRCRE